MIDYDSLLYRTDNVAGFYRITWFYRRNKSHFNFFSEKELPHLSLIGAGNLHNIIQRSLNTVINTGNQTWSSSTERGSPMDSTGSPGPSPEVSSYT